MGMRLGKARKAVGFMMESLERRELLTSAVEDVAPLSEPLDHPMADRKSVV